MPSKKIFNLEKKEKKRSLIAQGQKKYPKQRMEFNNEWKTIYKNDDENRHKSNSVNAFDSQNFKNIKIW